MEAIQEHALVIGSSFVTRLAEYQRVRFHGNGFTVHGCHVDVKGESGAVVNVIEQWLNDITSDVTSTQYSVIVIVCGSNDLCYERRTPEAVGGDLLRLAKSLVEQRGVKRVILCEVLHRQKRNSYFEIPLPEYNRKVVLTNDFLAHECSDQSSIVFWKHDHRVRLLKNLSADGIHLSATGMKFFHDSIYRSIWLHLKQILGIAK